MVSADLLGAYCLGISEAKRHHKRQWILAFQELLNLLCDVINLIKICTSHDVELSRNLLDDGSVLQQLVLMLGVAFPGKSLYVSIALLFRNTESAVAEIVQSENVV